MDPSCKSQELKDLYVLKEDQPFSVVDSDAFK